MCSLFIVGEICANPFRHEWTAPRYCGSADAMYNNNNTRPPIGICSRIEPRQKFSEIAGVANLFGILPPAG